MKEALRESNEKNPFSSLKKLLISFENIVIVSGNCPPGPIQQRAISPI